MTEIPEHLLKRSRERRAASGGESGSSASDDKSAAPAVPEGSAAAASAPATPAARAAAPEVAATPPPTPDSPVVAAAKQRKKIPPWAMAALALLPVWAFMYARSVTTQAQEVTGPLGIGADNYSVCASCHGGAGQGGVGYAFAGGEVLATFPNIEDQLRFVYFGTSSYQLADIDVYGNPDRPGGVHETGVKGVMPQQGSAAGGSLTDAEILGVVCHERYTIAGADAGGEFADEFEQWCSPESEIFLDLEAGGQLADLSDRFETVAPIGDAPAPGSPASE